LHSIIEACYKALFFASIALDILEPYMALDEAWSWEVNLGPQSQHIHPSIQFRNIIPKVYPHPHFAS
jgi:hypothetical protein